MENLRKLSESRPLLYCIASILSFVVILLPVAYLIEYPDIAPDTFISSALVEALLLLSGIVFIKGAGQDYVLQCKTRGFWKGLLSGGFFLVIGSYSFFYLGVLCLRWNELGEAAEELKAAGVDFSGYEMQSWPCIISFVIYALLIGLAEEFTFRGVIAERMLRRLGKDARGVKKAVLISGVLFGALHLVNGLSTGLLACTVQAVIASVMGMALTLIYYKCGSIYAVAFLHSFIDFGSLAWRGGIYASPASAADITGAMKYGSSNLIAIVPYGIVVLVLIRKKNIQAILKRISDCQPSADSEAACVYGHAGE